ncbi:MAG: 1,4-dihydroxy-2-naphthoate octaprenyltransferase [Actinomycetia bacterium]|nr:1,4-dihydroxy-2-naphthoate octaprenyltransferase [Actinomycetes bacterium]
MLKKWFEASRPWAFTAAIVPVCVGAGYAWLKGVFHPFLFVLTVIGGVLIQAGTNYINTYGDFKSGVDTVESAVTCPQLVSGAMKPATMKLVGIGCFAVAALIGVYLTLVSGWPLLIVGVLGIVAGYTYTAGIAYKYAGLGSILVFFLMGPMMVWGAYFVQTGVSDLNTLWISIPVACLVFLILHSNDLRDIAHDRAAHIKTLALLIDSDKNYVIYRVLVIVAYASIALLVVLRILPWTCLLIFVTLPWGIAQIRQSKAAQDGDIEKRNTLEPTTAQFHFKFGAVYFASLLLWLVAAIVLPALG